jgi:methylglutaconyl-CoA hydratase
MIITGAGGAFCAGMDIAALRAIASQSLEESLEDSRHVAQMFRLLHAFPKPLISAVDGPAVAGGCGIATLADFTLATPEAKFGYPEVRIGFIAAIVAVFLVRQVGEKRARELILSGQIIGSEEARATGLVTEIVPRDRLLGRAQELAEQLCAVSPTSLRFTKKLMVGFSEEELNRQIELAIQENASIRSTADFKEGLSAFLEKRKPEWKGR